MSKTRVMSIRLKRPSTAELQALVDAGHSDSLTYKPIGVTRAAFAPAGYRRDVSTRQLGRGDGVFETASHALETWRVQEGAGLIVRADGPPIVGMVVAMAAPLPIGFVEVVCRVIDVVEEPDRCSFAYGTLSVHPAQGEESFAVVRGPDGEITFEIVAVSRPRDLLARACPPIARRLQRAATQRYLDAMQGAVNT